MAGPGITADGERAPRPPRLPTVGWQPVTVLECARPAEGRNVAPRLNTGVREVTLRFSSFPCAPLRSTSSSVELISPINEAIVLISLWPKHSGPGFSPGPSHYGRPFKEKPAHRHTPRATCKGKQRAHARATGVKRHAESDCPQVRGGANGRQGRATQHPAACRPPLVRAATTTCNQPRAKSPAACTRGEPVPAPNRQLATDTAPERQPAPPRLEPPKVVPVETRAVPAAWLV